MTHAPHSAPTALTRRRFLQAGLATAAGTVFFPYVARANPLGANHRVRMALIGCGGYMQTHLGWARSHPGIELVALCDVKKDKLEEAARKVQSGANKPMTTADYGDIVAREDIDAVFVATPDHWHAAIAIAAMRSGKDVYVEKPMALTLGEGKAMVEAEQRYGRILQVGSMQRSDPAMRRAVEIVRNGLIGEVREVEVNFLGDFPPESLLPEEPVPATIDYDRWLGPAPWQPYNAERVLGNYGRGWRIFWDYGSRKNGDWGAHHFDIVQWALGMDGTGPDLFVPQGYEGAPHQYHVYPGGLKVSAAKGGPHAAGFMIRFIGTEGEVRTSRGVVESTPATLASRSLSPGDTRVYESADHRQNWLNSIISRRPPICPASIGRGTLDICALSGIAERLGRPVRWNPAEHEIVDDPLAARFADYPRRAGYPLPS
ncbi:MAG: Gfo/Idh/MocA family protein [Chthoniobacterales bacterium]|jgi:predicted dehydrogenase